MLGLVQPLSKLLNAIPVEAHLMYQIPLASMTTYMECTFCSDSLGYVYFVG
jgi:hypothetical protein